MVVSRCVRARLQFVRAKAAGLSELFSLGSSTTKKRVAGRAVKRLYRARRRASLVQPDQHVVGLHSHTLTSLWLMRTGRSTRTVKLSLANVHPTASWLIGDGARSSASSKPRPSTVRSHDEPPRFSGGCGKVQHVAVVTLRFRDQRGPHAHDVEDDQTLPVFALTSGPWWQNRKMIWRERPAIRDCRLDLWVLSLARSLHAARTVQ